MVYVRVWVPDGYVELMKRIYAVSQTPFNLEEEAQLLLNNGVRTELDVIAVDGVNPLLPNGCENLDLEKLYNIFPPDEPGVTA